MGDEYLSVPEVVCRAGNDKLPENVLIINMSSSLMCPSFYLGLCTIRKGACYAQRAENQYTKNVLPQRWKTDLMHTQMLQQYENGNKEPMKVYFRLIEKYIQLGNAYAVNSYKKELKPPKIDLQGVSSEFAEVQKIVSELEFGDTISSEDFLKLGDEANNYFTKMADGTYKLTGDVKAFYNLIMGSKVQSLLNDIINARDYGKDLNQSKINADKSLGNMSIETIGKN
jgi:hypothetical protein